MSNDNIQSEITYLRTVIQNQDFNTEPKKVDLKALLYEADAEDIISRGMLKAITMTVQSDG